MTNSRKKRFTNTNYYRGGMRWMGVGIEFCLVVGMFSYGGYWLGKLENKPGTPMTGMILGFAIGFSTMLYMMLKRAKKDEEERRAEEEREEREQRES